ncbi:MAG TPA: PKD domain-containing protein [Flavobacteriales bacterium]|nr:PKD domain-containing protein [Flavobacteriales bacterium]
MKKSFIELVTFKKGFSVFLFSFFVQTSTVFAQCSTFISTFPYTEGFETSAAWTSGGTNNDWAWGTPAHSVISSAGGGTKSWCAGGLTGSSYSASAQSWIMSPCFDFTSLNYPWISFKIFWETEYQWDGVTLQYSTNGGTTWANVGAYNDPVNCLNDNWFNYNNISWLTTASPKHGWSGRSGATSGSCTGGNGSGGWVTAQHCMNALANQPSVRFRFLFGSGTTCNNFDGVAIDDILIQDAPANTAGFTKACISSNTVSFTNTSAPCSTTYTWDFGDPSTGAQNTSTLANPSHMFSGPGTYTVTLTANAPCGAPGISTQTVTINAIGVLFQNVTCNGASDGSVTVTGASSSSTFVWNTTPVQTTATATGLGPGSYTATISDPMGCSSSATAFITEPPAITLTLSSTPSCPDVCNGTVNVSASGGTGALTYAWAGLGAGASQTNVCTGSFTATVTDVNGCSNMNTVTVDALPSPTISVQPVTICQGQTATLTATGGITYTWWPSAGLNDTTASTVVTNADTTTTYNVLGTSAGGCPGITTVTVTVNPIPAPVTQFIVSTQQPDVFHPEVFFTNLTNGTNEYYWDFGGIGSSTEINPYFSFPVDSAGTYQVCLSAQNSVGCSSTMCQYVSVKGFTSIFVPNAFTPDGDGTNEILRPVARDISRMDYRFRVFDRAGQLIFMSASFEQGWDGTHEGRPCKDGVYIYNVHFIEPETGTAREISGHFTLIR